MIILHERIDLGFGGLRSLFRPWSQVNRSADIRRIYMEHRDTLFDSLVVYVESHCVCGINPFGEGIEQEEQSQLLSQRLLLALQLPGLPITVSARS